MNEALSRYILEVLHCKKDITRNKWMCCFVIWLPPSRVVCCEEPSLFQHGKSASKN
jgi:hypothetical protein